MSSLIPVVVETKVVIETKAQRECRLLDTYETPFLRSIKYTNCIFGSSNFKLLCRIFCPLCHHYANRKCSTCTEKTDQTEKNLNRISTLSCTNFHCKSCENTFHLHCLLQWRTIFDTNNCPVC
jgi:hypothetical protein